MNDTPTRKPGAPDGNHNRRKGTETLKRRTIGLTNTQWQAIQKAADAAGTTPNGFIQNWADSLNH